MATPVQFPQQNANFSKPEGWTDEQCISLPAYVGEMQDQDTLEKYPTILSCWQFSPAEMAELNRNGGKCWLNLVSPQMVPVSVFVTDPFASLIIYSIDIPYGNTVKFHVPILNMELHIPDQPEKGGSMVIRLEDKKAIEGMAALWRKGVPFDTDYSVSQDGKLLEEGRMYNCRIVFTPDPNAKIMEGVAKTVYQSLAKLTFETCQATTR